MARCFGGGVSSMALRPPAAKYQANAKDILRAIEHGQDPATLTWALPTGTNSVFNFPYAIHSKHKHKHISFRNSSPVHRSNSALVHRDCKMLWWSLHGQSSHPQICFMEAECCQYH